MVSFALKGAVIDYPQIEARAKCLSHAGLPLCLELHTFGHRDLYDSERRKACLSNLTRLEEEFGNADLTVHIPFQDVDTVTSELFDARQVADTLEFAQQCGSGRIVMHRYWGMMHGDTPPRSSRAEATAGFNETIRELSLLAPEVALLVENMGHYFLASRKPDDYLAGPLDHFFPWEIAEFSAYLDTHEITNVFPFVDVAHATLTSNLFNYRRQLPSGTDLPAYFSGITNDDLDRASNLHPFDFVDEAMPWLHISDSRLTHCAADQNIPQEALTCEGLEIGVGNLPFSELPERLAGGASDTVLLLEVEPGDGETYVDNGAQYRSLERLRRYFSLQNS
mgnify:CR=1 FL=1